MWNKSKTQIHKLPEQQLKSRAGALKLESHTAVFLLAENTDEHSKQKNDLGLYICEDLKIFIMALYFPID